MSFAAESNQVAQKVIVERHDHQEGNCRSCFRVFPNLPGIKDEILAGEPGFFLASVAELSQRAAEEFAFGEDREWGASGRRDLARAGGSKGSRIVPRDGEAGFSSAMGRFEGAPREGAAAKSRTGGHLDAIFQRRFGAIHVCGDRPRHDALRGCGRGRCRCSI